MGKYDDFFYYMSLLGYLGFIMAFNILIFLFAYRLLAKKIGDNAFVMFIFLILGVVSAFYNAYKILMKKK